MFPNLNRIFSQNNRSGKNSNFPGINVDGMNVQHRRRQRAGIKNPWDDGYQIPNFLRKRKWQKEPTTRLPLQMTVTPLVWRENPDIDSEEDKENYWVAQNSCGGLYQRNDEDNQKTKWQQKRRRTTSGKRHEESFISHSQRILDRIRKQQLSNLLKKRDNCNARENCRETLNKVFSDVPINNSSEKYGKNSTVQPNDEAIDDVLQSPLRSMASSPSESEQQTPLTSMYRSSNKLSDSDESPSVPSEDSENVLTVTKKQNYNRPMSPLVDDESVCGFERCSLLDSEEGLFQWNPVVTDSPPVKDIVDIQINQELNDDMILCGPSVWDSRDDFKHLNDFNERNDSVLNVDSIGNPVNSSCVSNDGHSRSNNGVKNCFQQCEDYWSRGGKLCFETTYEESVSLTFMTEPQYVTPFAHVHEDGLSFLEE